MEQKKWYEVWLPIGLSVFAIVVEIALAIYMFGLSQRVDRQLALPRIVQLGTIPQFARDDKWRMVRLKNLSTRQDATILRVEYAVTAPEFLARLEKRLPFVDGPPRVQLEETVPASNEIELLDGDWNRDGRSFTFRRSLDTRIEPGKTISLLFRIGDPKWKADVFRNAWFNGTLTFVYEDGEESISDVNLFHKSCERLPDIPPTW